MRVFFILNLLNELVKMINCEALDICTKTFKKSHSQLQSYGPDKLIYDHFRPLTTKCDMDLGDIDVIHSHDTLSYYGEHL